MYIVAAVQPKVAFFASATGEVERLADIFNEYAIPYQLGLEQFESTPAYLAQRAYMSGASAHIYLIKGVVPHGTVFQDTKLVLFGSEDLFETSELISRGPSSKTARETFSADIIDLKPGDYVVHSEHGREALARFGFDARVIPHPVFPSDPPRADDGHTVLFFGVIRPFNPSS